MQRWLIIIGIVILAAGLLWPWLAKLGLGRLPGEARWAPRPIDLDILLYDERIVREEGLTIPHPAMHERMFVLEPLGLVAPRARHPVLRQTVEEMLHACIQKEAGFNRKSAKDRKVAK